MTDPAPVTPLTCLIVDDSPPFFEAARQLLADDGITVVGFAATSDEAVDQTLALRPDVALVDVDLGIESGFDVAQRLAGLPARRAAGRPHLGGVRERARRARGRERRARLRLEDRPLGGRDPELLARTDPEG